MFGNQQVGEEGGQAALWFGTPNSYVNLRLSSGWRYSYATAASEKEQVGYYSTLAQPLNDHAVLWHGSAQSAIDLHPTGATSSFATGIADGHEGGYTETGGARRAVLWSGSAASVVSMHPGPAFSESAIFGMAPGQQVGYAVRIGQNEHAALWTGIGASHIDLNPSIAGVSQLNATCGSAQVGYASTNLYGVTAGIWFGSAESFVPFAPFMPANYGQSIATSVATDGVRYYVGGYARNLDTNRDEAFLWIGDALGACYANCDHSTTQPVLNITDFVCFSQRFAAGEPYANCDASSRVPVINVNDFVCFMARFVAGCP